MTLERSKALRRDGPGARAFADKRSRLNAESPKRRRQRGQRAKVVAAVKERDGRCVGPDRGLPGRCWGRIDVHEVVPRGRDSTSWLDVDRCVALCRRHHEDVTSAHGEALERARAAGLDVKAGPLQR